MPRFTTDKIKGVANEAAGSVKEGVGKAVGSDKLRAEGAAQELKGHAQKAVGDAKDAVKTAVNKSAEHVNQRAWWRSDDEVNGPRRIIVATGGMRRANKNQRGRHP